MALAALIAKAASDFEAAGIESAQVDAELLAAHILQTSRGELQARLIAGDIELSPSQTGEFESFVARRAAREPLQHLTGQAHFRNITLKVGKGVFVPRPETEFVTGLAIDDIKTRTVAEPVVVDLCAGSGAIGLAIASELAHTRVFGVEKSTDAIDFTRANYSNIAPENAKIILGDMADAFHELDGLADFVISNPSYIPADMVPIYPEVALHDPALALYGGSDGLDLIRVVSNVAKRLLKTGGGLAIEHADMQAEQVRQLLLNDGWRLVQTHQDFNSRDRAATAIR
jgi:release factor glutamine methyltransferase